MGSMVMNIAANMLGLGNAATPMGLRAMGELQKLNPHPGVATNAMCTFLAINTGSVQLIPVTAIGLLTINGGKNPTLIVGTALLATLCAQITALTAVKFFEKLPMFRVASNAATTQVKTDGAAEKPIETIAAVAQLPPLPAWRIALIAVFVAFFGYLACSAFLGFAGPNTSLWTAKTVSIAAVKSLSLLAVPFFLAFFPLLRGIARCQGL